MTGLPPDHAARLARAKLSLNGVSLGDAFGQRFFGPHDRVMAALARRELPRAPWGYTDDTVMALSVYEVLERYGRVEQDALARAFGAKYVSDPNRGDGPGAHRLLRVVAGGADWREASRASFGGVGSFGNGAAMRVAPVGAYFADDLARATQQAIASAEITHAHPEGVAGAVAVAVAAACCASRLIERDQLFDAVLDHTPAGETRRGIVAAREVAASAAVETAAGLLGSGGEVTAQDTVPFVIWCIARHPTDFVEGMWATVSGLGDRDTTCAMVAGAVVLTDDGAGVPAGWYDAREPLSRLAGLGVVD